MSLPLFVGLRINTQGIAGARTLPEHKTRHSVISRLRNTRPLFLEEPMRSRGVAFLALATLLFLVRPVAATPILDQSNVVLNPGIAFGFSVGLSLAQTFTVGITGFLTSLDVQVQEFALATEQDLGFLDFEITTTVAGVPGTNLTGGSLAATAVSDSFAVVPPLGSPYPFVTLDFPDIAVTAGDQLAIVLTRSVPQPMGWWSQRLGMYPGGHELLGPGNLFWIPVNVGDDLGDAGFRTFVEPSAVAVPEPASLVLLGSGLVAARWWQGRRTRPRDFRVE